MKEFITKSDKETFAFAKKFAKKLKGGEVIGLIGGLGAGKTVFAQGLAAGLGVKGIVNSPTFVLMKVYSIKNLKPACPAGGLKIKNFVHIDAYRITKPEDITAIGAPEYFGRSDTVTAIEWADKINKKLPSASIIIKLVTKKSKIREIIC